MKSVRLWIEGSFPFNIFTSSICIFNFGAFDFYIGIDATSHVNILLIYSFFL